MKASYLILLIGILICPLNTFYAQKAVQVTKPVLSLQENRINISYDLINTSPEERFTIRIEATDSQGNLIHARALSGDIGDGIPGGRNKLITWDIEADSIYLDEEIYIQVFAAGTPVMEQADLSVNDVATPVSEKQFSRTGIILQSLVLPGLGLSRMHRGQPHWIRGVVGYGCIAGSVYLNRKAVSSYDAYRNPADPDEVDALFNRALQQDNISEILGYAAAGVWIADFVWTFIGSSALNQEHIHAGMGMLSLGAAVEPVSRIPVLALKIQF
jgi:hypothetical protein